MRVGVPSNLAQRRKPTWAVPPGDEPHFRPDSIYARVWGEKASYMGLPRMLLTQGAHPLVYTGIVGHSAYAGDQFGGRVLRTAGTFRTLAFAPRSEADRYLSVVREMHGRVRGKLKDYGGPLFPEGTPFTGKDQELLMWALYAVFESFELAYHSFVQRLTREEKEAHWQDYRLAGRLFGVEEDALPRTRADVEDYARYMYSTDKTFVTEIARNRAVPFVTTGRHPESEAKEGEKPKALVPWYAQPVFKMVKAFTITTLQPKVREQYGLSETAAQRAVTRVSTRVSPVLVRRLPPHVRKRPDAVGRDPTPWSRMRIREYGSGMRTIDDADPNQKGAIKRTQEPDLESTAV
jgi:uncharacterized protein (DUF2236 family)